MNDRLVGRLAADEHEVSGRVESLHQHSGSLLFINRSKFRYGRSKMTVTCAWLPRLVDRQRHDRIARSSAMVMTADLLLLSRISIQHLSPIAQTRRMREKVPAGKAVCIEKTHYTPLLW